MLALVKTRPEPGVELMQRPAPSLTRPTDVLIQVEACGVCGSDVHCYRWEQDHAPGMSLPVVLGHEIAGTVVAAGPQVNGYRPGDRVVAESLARCGDCHYCSLGAFNHCEVGERLGHTVDGGMARLVVVPSAALFHIPSSLSFSHAALLKPLGVALRAFERAPLHPGETVAVVGPGTVGLLAGLVARAAGAAEVAIVGLERDRRRLDLAQRLGITAIGSDPVDRVRDLCGGRGAHLSIDASGGAGTLRLVVDLTRPTGSIALLGISPPDTVRPVDIVMKELTLVGALTRLPETWHRAIGLLASGAVDVEPLITHRLPLEDAELGFQALLDGDAVKVVLEPGRAA